VAGVQQVTGEGAPEIVPGQGLAQLRLHNLVSKLLSRRDGLGWKHP